LTSQIRQVALFIDIFGPVLMKWPWQK